MKTKLFLLLLTTLAWSAPGFALPVLVDEWMGGSGDSTEKIAIRTAINEYNATNPDLPQLFDNTNPKPGSQPNLLENWYELNPGSLSAYSTDKGVNSVQNWTAGLGYTSYYVMTKWGKGPKKTFDHVLHYVPEGQSIVNYNPGGAKSVTSLSHVRVWGYNAPKVPDSGATAALVAMGLALCAFARRRITC